MMEKQYILFLGNYGSGKTEIALNAAAIHAKAGKRVALVDLDIINPYFRSAEKRAFLQALNVHVIASKYVNTAIDLPLIPPEVHAVFSGQYEHTIFDIGGDAVGATALGGFHEQFSRIRDHVGVYYVVNIRRPLSSTKERIIDMLYTIQAASRLSVDGFINNSNLGAETTKDDLIQGQMILRDVSEKMNIPIAYTSGMANILDEATQASKLDGERLLLTRHMALDWQSME